MEVVLLIGLQGSGKSTFFRERFADTHVHVSKDLMPPSARNKGRRQRELIAQALAEGRSVVVDNTNVSREDRAEPIAQARAQGARVVGFVFDTPIADCLRRNATRTGRARVPEVAIFATRKRFVPPTLEEGFDALYRVKAGDGFEVTPLQP